MPLTALFPPGISSSGEFDLINHNSQSLTQISLSYSRF
jgi:hypothetical protein